MSSYQGQDTFGYEPVMTVDEVADYTGMMTGGETVENLSAARHKKLRESPVKSLAALWFFILLLYSLIAFTFRRNLA